MVRCWKLNSNKRRRYHFHGGRDSGRNNPILFAVDTIPDMGQRVANVTSDMAAVKVVAKGEEIYGNFNG
ncbi:MAG: hypothetical protein ABIU09_06860 [Pyrinomonadaceae bacterium]